jgi:hypothetical protein
MLFQAVMKFLSRLVEFKILVNWGMVEGMVHWNTHQTFILFNLELEMSPVTIRGCHSHSLLPRRNEDPSLRIESFA